MAMTSVPNMMKRLQHLDFPECTREALEYIVSAFASQDRSSIPGLSGGPETVVGEVCQAFVLFRTKWGVKVQLHEHGKHFNIGYQITFTCLSQLLIVIL